MENTLFVFTEFSTRATMHVLLSTINQFQQNTISTPLHYVSDVDTF